MSVPRHETNAREIACAALCGLCILAMAWMAFNPVSVTQTLGELADYVWRLI